jgi:hypothetical protein
VRLKRNHTIQPGEWQGVDGREGVPREKTITDPEQKIENAREQHLYAPFRFQCRQKCVHEMIFPA